MRSIIVAAVFLATVGAAWGQDMMPNVTLSNSPMPIITIPYHSVISIGTNIGNTLHYTVEFVTVTNTFQPVQYRDQWKSSLVLCNSGSWVAPSTDGDWLDTDPLPWFNNPKETRPNPNVRITEVREIRTLCFEFEGKAHRIELHNTASDLSRR